MKRVLLISLATIFLPLMGCSGDSNDSLIGCYAGKVGGKPRVSIERREGDFFMKLRREGEWTEGYRLHEGSASELDEIYGESAKHVKTSLIADEGSLALFKVDPGPMNKSSKYQAVLLLLAGDVYRVACD